MAGRAARAGGKILENYSITELNAVRRFLEDALALQQQMTAKLLQREQKKLRR
jgi:hypothetical protein